MPDDKFQFVFTHLDALEAVAEQGRRCNLGRAFGYPEAWRLMVGYTRQDMISLGWYLDPTTECWFPHWWPEWAR